MSTPGLSSKSSIQHEKNLLFAKPSSSNQLNHHAAIPLSLSHRFLPLNASWPPFLVPIRFTIVNPIAALLPPSNPRIRVIMLD
jgi:hypothetical protein